MTLSKRDRIHLHNPSAMLTFAATLTPPPPPAELEQAIAAAYALHERLNQRVDYSGEAEQCVAGYSLLAAELEQDDEWSIAALEQQYEPLDIENGEMARFIILEGSSSTQLITMMHQLAGDGDSLVRLVHDILNALNGKVPSPYATVLPHAPDNDHMTIMNRSVLRMMGKRWQRSGRAFSQAEYLDVFNRFWTRENEMLTHTLPVDTAKKVVDKCAEEGVSVTNALITAFAQTEAVAGEMALSVNRRPADYGGMGNFDLSVRISYTPKSGEFWTFARTAQNSIKTRFAEAEAESFLVKALNAMPSTIIDAAWHNAYADFSDEMAKQARDMLGISATKEIALHSLVTSLSPAYGRYTVSEAWYVPPYAPGSRRTLGMVIHNGAPFVTMQCDVDQPDPTVRLSLLDAMNRLSEQV